MKLSKTPMRYARRVLAASLLASMLGAGLVHAAPVYQWKDARGVVHYADRPPAEPPPGGYIGPKPVTVGEAYRQEREAARRRRIEEARQAEEQARKAAAAAAAARANAPKKEIRSRYSCAEAKQILSSYKRPHGRYFHMQKDGRFTPTTPDQMKATTQEWEKAVTALCAKDVKIVPLHDTHGAGASQTEASAAGEGGAQPEAPPPAAPAQ